MPKGDEMKLQKIFAGLFLILVGAAGLQAAPALKVLSAAPQGQQDAMGRRAVNIHFNQPVVKLGEATAFSSSNCPLVISPNVQGACRFEGTQTLVFEPAQDWPQATQFTVTLPKGFSSAVSGQKLAQPYHFSFTTQVPRVIQVLPYDNEHWISLNPTLYVLTSLPVNLSRAAEFISLVPAQSKSSPIKVAVRVPTQEELNKNFSYLSVQEKQAVFALNPTQTLQKDEKYTLQLHAGLPAQTGTAGLAKTYETSFYTFPSLQVQKINSTGCLPFVPSLQLSSPVRKYELYDAIETVPASAKLALPDKERDSLGSEFTNPKTGEAYFTMPLSFISVKPHEKVEVLVKKDLRDIYGNSLPQDQRFSVTNDGYCPAVDFSSDGVGVLESYLPARLPISLMNIPSLFVQVARFNRENFIPFYEKTVSYCAKKVLPGAVFSGDYEFKPLKDTTLRTYIDLTRFKPTAKDSIIFSQIKTKRSSSQEDCWLSATDNITDVGVTFKTSPDSILIWTTSLKTGEPLPAMSVELRSKENRVVWTGTTNENGLAIAPGWGKLDVPAAQWGQPALYAFITSPGGDSVISNLWNEGMEPWRLNVDYDYNPTAQPVKAYLFTQRGVYRPGETVYIKGIVREQTSGLWKLPDLVRGTLTVHDSRGEEVLNKEVTISSDFGTFDVSLDLPSTAPTGYWDVSFSAKWNHAEVAPFYTSFQVESVKPADFNVFIKADQSSYLGGEEATFSAAAQYYFGAPLSMAKARWTLRPETTWFTPKGYEDYTFVPYFLLREEDTENGKILLNASGELDSRGALLFASKMPRVKVPTNVYAQVEIESPAHQNLFKRTSVLVHPADIYIGAKPLSQQHEQGQPVDIRLVAVTPQGQPAETEATAHIYMEQYYSVRKVGLSGRLEWVSDKKVIPLPSQRVTIGKKGTVLSFVPQQAGSYFIKLTAKDLFGRDVQGGVDVYVSGTSDSYAARRDDDLLPLKQNKNEYKVGQTARVRVQSAYQTARALVTVEREGVLDAWTTTLRGGENVINVPIKSSYLPNVYVSVTAVQGRSAKPADYKEDLGKPQSKIGYVNLNVIPNDKRLATTLKTNAKKYEPGQQVVVDVSTKVRGKAVPAEVVVMAVDEGILALTNYQTPDLFGFFYASSALSVFTVDNRSYVIGQRNFGEKGENRGGDGAVMSSKLAGTDLRSRFVFTPYYASAVKTDAKGRAQVSFELPDNLTTFRIMAVSLTESEFGKAESSITVSKPVMITANLPRFAREADHFACGAIVYNYEDTKGTFVLQAHAQGAVTLDNPAPQTVQIPKGQSREVTWMCRAGKAGQGSVTFSAQGRYSDAVKTSLTVFAPERAQTLMLSGATQQAQTQVVQKPARVNPAADNRVDLSVASTALLQLKGAISYLLTYPYNCLEQQLSKLVPAVTAARLVTDFKLASQQDLQKQSQSILDNLGAYQHSSGGFGYWPNSNFPDVYLTAYALEVALQAKQAGFDVPTQTIEKAVSWLSGAFNNQTVQSPVRSVRQQDVSMAYGVYVLGLYGKNIDSLFNTLYAKREALPPAANAFLLQAAQVTGRSADIKNNLAQQLLNKIVYTPTAAYVQTNEDIPWLHQNGVTATARTLQALLQAHLSPENDYQLVTWLLSQLNAQGHWNDTHTNAVVLSALQTYYATREQETPHFTALVKQARQEVVLNESFNGRSLEEHTRSLPFSQVYQKEAEVPFSFAKQGTGTLYYTLAQHYTPLAYDTPVDAGFSVTRTITALDGSAVEKVLTGERYKVTLRIKTPATRTFVVVEDFLAAGFTLVNTGLATESDSQAQLLFADNTAFNHIEQYDDRIYGFSDELSAGEHTFSYLVTAVAAGTYTYPSAWASQMYAPAVFGRNATSTLAIK